MRISRIVLASLLVFVTFGAWGQQKGSDVVVDYNRPKKYIVGGVGVEGNTYFSSDQILQNAGLHEGMQVTVPSEEMTSVVRRLWLQRCFEDVAVVVDSITPSADTAFFKIRIIERPRVSRWTFSGVKSGEQKELQERLGDSFKVKDRFEQNESLYKMMKY